MEEDRPDPFDVERAVISKPGARTEPEEPHSNGASAPNAAAKNGARPALFWNAPLGGQDELNWFVPPVPEREARDVEVEGMLNQFGAMLDKQPRRAWLLKWNYRTRAAATGAELHDVEQEAQEQIARLKEQSERDVLRLDAKINFLRESQQTLETELIEAKKDFAECAARAGLNCSTQHEPEPRRRVRSQPPVEHDTQLLNLATITPQRVEEALEYAKPTLQELAGEHGVGPVGHTGFLSMLLQFFMQFLAPLVAGLMLALCLGTLVGIIDIDTLQRSDGGPQLVLCAALGFVIVYLMGEVYHSAVSLLARSLEARQPWEGGSHLPVPRLRGALGIAIGLASIALFLGLAEITAEGMGIRQLHDQQVAREQRFKSSMVGRKTQDVPLIIYMLIGTLISGPYLVYKSARGWGDNETHQREAWLTHLQRMWLEERREESDVQQAFHHAYVVEHLDNSLRNVKTHLQEAEKERDQALHVELHPSVQARRQAARAAAVGEAARLQQTLEDIVETTEPLHQPPVFDARAYGPNGRNGVKRGTRD